MAGSMVRSILLNTVSITPFCGPISYTTRNIQSHHIGTVRRHYFLRVSDLNLVSGGAILTMESCERTQTSFSYGKQSLRWTDLTI
jgi:hypothetical protein